MLPTLVVVHITPADAICIKNNASTKAAIAGNMRIVQPPKNVRNSETAKQSNRDNRVESSSNADPSVETFLLTICANSASPQTTMKKIRTHANNAELALVVKPAIAWKMLSIGTTYGYQLLARGELESYLDGISRKITVQSIKDYIARRANANYTKGPRSTAATAARTRIQTTQRRKK